MQMDEAFMPIKISEANTSYYKTAERDSIRTFGRFCETLNCAEFAEYELLDLDNKFHVVCHRCLKTKWQLFS